MIRSGRPQTARLLRDSWVCQISQSQLMGTMGFPLTLLTATMREEELLSSTQADITLGPAPILKNAFALHHSQYPPLPPPRPPRPPRPPPLPQSLCHPAGGNNKVQGVSNLHIFCPTPNQSAGHCFRES